MRKRYWLSMVGCLALLGGAFAGEVKSFSHVCRDHDPGAAFDVQCWASDGLTNGEGAVYVFLEHRADLCTEILGRLAREGAVPPGIAVFVCSGWLKTADGRQKCLRGEEFDQIGPEFPTAVIEEILPAAERALGVTAARKADLNLMLGNSSGGCAAFNACWYRNDFFRRCFASSPTFSAMRSGNALMPLVRRAEARPIRAWMSVGTDEPDYFFGDSYHVAMDAASALRYSGYELHFDRFPHMGHGNRWAEGPYVEEALRWLYRDWKSGPVKRPAGPIRVRDAVGDGSTWEPCSFDMPKPVREMVSSDGTRVYSVSPTNRFVTYRTRMDDGSLGAERRLAPLELAWNASSPGGRALVQAEDGRVFVASELGVQGVVDFGLADLVLPLPGDLPCDNLAYVGKTLYAASGDKVFRREMRKAAAPAGSLARATTRGYGDGFPYMREHEPADGMADLLGSYVTAGRIAGVVSVLSDADYNVRFDCAGWASGYGDRAKARPMASNTVFAVFSMTKTFTGAAIMCAIDEGKMSLDDEVAKYLPEFADVKMKDGSKPKRPLTLLDITSHVSGFRGGAFVVNRDIPLREVARQLASHPLEFQPGETFQYGNAWIDSAAACLEVAVGEPYEKYLQRKILDPLGMKDTTFWPDAEQLERLVTAYTTDDKEIRVASDSCARQLVFPKKAKVFPAASGGLFSTPADMIRFSQMLAHHGEWKGRRLISRETFDRVFAVKQTPATIKAPYSVGSWIYGDWFGHEGAMRTDQRANLRTGQSRVFFIQTENAAGRAFFQLKREWHDVADGLQHTPATVFGN